MKLVIDTNRIIAALIKDSISRKLLFDENFEFVTPDHSLSEIHKYEDEIRRKAKISHEEFEILLYIIFEKIEIVPKSDYENSIKEAKKLISDIGDVPFIAVCLALKADGIWSDDSHFLNQRKVKIFRTEDLVKLVL